MITENAQKPKKNRKYTQSEARIQSSAVVWMNNERPETRGLFFCVSNENTRSAYESKKQQLMSGAMRRMLGVVPGVSDTILMMPRGKYHAACFEFKTEKGRQSDVQARWQEKVEKEGYYYTLVRSLDEFKNKVNMYLGLKNSQ